MSLRCTARLNRAGRSLGRRRPANIRLSPGVPRRLRPESQALCHSERSEESFPLRTKGRGRTMPSKEEKDKRSAVKDLFGERLQILRRSAPQNDKLFIVRKLRGRLEYATGGNASRYREKMFEATAACRTKHRLQPCEPKPRHAEARNTRPAGFGTNPSATCESCVCKSTLLLNRANAACGGTPGDSRSGEPPRREAAARATLRITKPQNEKNRRKKNARQNKQFLIPPAP